MPFKLTFPFKNKEISFPVLKLYLLIMQRSVSLKKLQETCFNYHNDVFHQSDTFVDRDARYVKKLLGV